MCAIFKIFNIYIIILYDSREVLCFIFIFNKKLM